MGRITRGSHITYYSIMFLLDTLLKDKCMCLQGELKLYVTRPAGQVQCFFFVLGEWWRGLSKGEN